LKAVSAVLYSVSAASLAVIKLASVGCLAKFSSALK
jgi:hypothetical protein